MKVKNLRHFSATEKALAEKELINWMTSRFDLPEGKTCEAIAHDAIEEASTAKVVDLFDKEAMVKQLTAKSRSVIRGAGVMIKRKKLDRPGRPSAGKVKSSISFDPDIWEYVKDLGWGERSSFINQLIRERLS